MSRAEEIRAEYEGEVMIMEAKAKLIEARAKLHPLAQAIYAFFDAAPIGGFLWLIGVLGFIALLVINDIYT